MRKGFSLLELIVVLAIIGVLVTIVGVRLGNTLSEARQTRIDADLAILLTAAEQFCDRYPNDMATDQAALVQAGVLAAEIESPLVGYRYSVFAGENRATVALKKGEEVFEQEDYRAECSSTRLHPDRAGRGTGDS